ncbi:MAG: hypothetical protein J6575_04390 [Bifidobacterium sp.]|nr:hypothetical protein [Bifidobacterium sp.]
MRTRSKKAKHCPSCGGQMKKNGRTAAGTQRWKCYMRSPHPDTGATLNSYLRHVRRRAEQARAAKTQSETKTGDEPGTGIDWNKFHTATRYPNAAD